MKIMGCGIIFMLGEETPLLLNNRVKENRMTSELVKRLKSYTPEQRAKMNARCLLSIKLKGLTSEQSTGPKAFDYDEMVEFAKKTGQTEIVNIVNKRFNIN